MMSDPRDATMLVLADLLDEDVCMVDGGGMSFQGLSDCDDFVFLLVSTCERCYTD